MKTLPRRLLAVACAILVVARAQAIVPWPMADGNYFEGFGTIATWTNNFVSPTEATRWGSAAVNGSGTIPDGRRTSVATTAFTTTTTAGVQRGTSNLVQLSTGSTDNSSANAVDLYLDFTGRAPGTLAFDWTALTNDTGNRASSLRVYTSTNGVTFVELTNARVLNLSNNVVAAGSIKNLPLPAAFSNCATARLRFYEYNGTGGSTGKRSKIAIDNVSVTYAVLPVVITLPATGASNTVATLNGTVNPGGAATTAWFEWGFYEVNNSNLTAPVTVGGGVASATVTNFLSSLTPGVIYHARLVASNAAGFARGSDITFGSPVLTLVGAATMTNECHGAFADPGALATGTPLAIAEEGVHCLVLKSDGTVAAWGSNLYGETTVPVGLNNVAGVAGGNWHSLALKRDGTVVAWGAASSEINFGQTTVPPGLNSVVAIAGGGYYSLALKSDGTVVAWGRNGDGETDVPLGLSGVVAIAGATTHSLALKSDGTVVAWGGHFFGETSVPAGLNNVVAIAAAGWHSLALKSDGTVVSWGDNLYGETIIPEGLSNVVAISSGALHTAALKRDGTVLAWGNNDYGQTNIPVGLSNVVAIAVGSWHSLALKSDGTLTAWGWNAYGQSAIPAGISTIPVTVTGTFHPNNAPGTYTRTYTSGNFLSGLGTATRTVVVRDTTLPAITILGSNPITSECHAAYTDAGATAYDACSGVRPLTVSNLVNTNVLGSYTVTYTADDGNGQTNTATRTVVVRDSTPPVITILGSNPLTNECHAAYTDPGATANAICAGMRPVAVSNLVNVNAPGSYSVTYTADNGSGLTATATRVVVVRDSTPPVLTILGSNPFTNECHAAYIDPGVIATATCAGARPVTASNLINVNSPGSYTVTYTADNGSGLTATATRTVVVRDTQPPVITLLGGNPFTNQLNVPFVDPGATALDACGGKYAVTTNSTVNGAVLGTYFVSYIGTDSFGNSATNVRTVVISPVPPVVKTLPATGVSNTVATLNGTITAGTLPTTFWFEWKLDGGNTTNLTVPLAMGGGADVVAVSNLLSGLSPSLIYRGRLVASNDEVVVRGLDVLFGSPLLTLRGAATMTNECHATFSDPGAATGAPLAIAGGVYYSLVLKGDGTVAAWGYSYDGLTNIPVGLSNVMAIAAGAYHSLALKIDGTVIAWGSNGDGQSSSSAGQTNVPVGLSNVIAIAGGFYHSLALKGDGTVTAWGLNYNGQTNIPAGLSNVIAIAAGYFHSLALKSDGTVVAWGYNYYGQTTISAGLSNVVGIAGGGYHSLALKRDGTVAAWGYNFDGETDVPLGLSNVVTIAGGRYHALALKSDGTVVAWGANGSRVSYGQTNVPVGLSGVAAIAGGGYHSLALKSDGTVVAWGQNSYGQTIIPVDLSTVDVTVGGTFQTNNSPGTYTRNYSASNSLGGIASPVTRTIVVQDTTPPVITLLGNNPLTLLANTVFVDPGATALDACDGGHAVTTNNLVNVAVPGSYAVSYLATDSLGHSATNARIVNVVAAPPQVISPVRLGNGTFQFGFTNEPGVGFTVWASTNVALPLAQWSNLGAPLEAPAGTFLFTDPQATNQAQRFYRLSSP